MKLSTLLVYIGTAIVCSTICINSVNRNFILLIFVIISVSYKNLCIHIRIVESRIMNTFFRRLEFYLEKP